MRPDFNFDAPQLPHAWHHSFWMPDWLSPALLAGAVALYVVPSLVAFRRNHHNRVAIALLNVLLGWTFIAWALALVWAATATAVHPPAAPPRPPWQGRDPSGHHPSVGS